MSVDLTVSTADHSGVTVVSVSGEIDVYTAPRLRDRLTELVDQGKYRLVVDLTDVRFMDSTGLGVLVGALKKVRTHAGRLDLVCDNERLLKIFKITGLTKVFVIHPVVGTALDD